MGGGRGRGRGRGGRSRTQRKHFQQNRDNVWKRSDSDPPADSVNPALQRFATQNPAFDKYYKEQGIVAPEEWDAFMEVLRKPLPSAFRINSSSQFCEDIRSQLENDFMISLQAEFTDGEELVPIRPLSWYPDNFAWHSNFSRMQLRKNQNLERFHEFLKLENEIGNITRQEAVSMVPPLFLDVHPDHFILDMCAAPGSKTFQLLEIIHKSTGPGSLPDGMVVANDLDVQRCNLLIHQTKRICTSNLIVTNHEAQQFPGCCLKTSSNEIGSEPSINQILFDRVLCDVPCSGDGTLRKAPDIWRRWSVGTGNGLHSLQLQIAMRGVSLLKVGGRMVYSTCSMNPVENEAVVAEILRRCSGSIELVDVSGELPQLVRRQGLKQWKIHNKGSLFMSYKDVPKLHRNVILPSMFPAGRSHSEPTELGEEVENGVIAGNGVQSTEDSVASTEDLHDDVCDLPLEHCMRILPHDQNGGAFFIAVFHKLSPLPVIQEKSIALQDILPSGNSDLQNILVDEVTADINGLEVDTAYVTGVKFPEASSEVDLNNNGSDGSFLEPRNASEEQVKEPELKESPAPGDKETNPGKAVGKRRLQMQGRWRGVDPVVFLKDETIINSIRTFYGIDESFPLSGHLVTRNADTDHMKRLYYVSKSVKDVLELNFLVGQQLKITSIGLKIFERQSAIGGSIGPCPFRLSSEGLPLILPYLTKQILCASPVDFKHLLENKTIKFSKFTDAEFGEKVSKLMLGCCVILLGKGEKSSSDRIHVDKSTVAIACWKGRGSLTVMVTAIDCQELLARLSARNAIEKDTFHHEDNGTVSSKQEDPVIC